MTEFLSSLALENRVAAATQNQALAALLSLYRHVLDLDLPWLDHIVRAKGKVRVPGVVSPLSGLGLTSPDVEDPATCRSIENPGRGDEAGPR